jgi:hypothetical protein
MEYKSLPAEVGALMDLVAKLVQVITGNLTPSEEKSGSS